jgi:hypothetical protein
MFEHAMLRARNRGIDTLSIHALSENAAMLAIARKAGPTVERDGPEAQAWLKLPPDTFASHFVDFRLKSQARLLDNWFAAFDEVSTHIKRNAGNSME